MVSITLLATVLTLLLLGKVKAPRRIWPRSKLPTPLRIVLTPVLTLWIISGDEGDGGLWGWKLDGSWIVILSPLLELAPLLLVLPEEDGMRMGVTAWDWDCPAEPEDSRISPEERGSSSLFPPRIPPAASPAPPASFLAFLNCFKNVMTGVRESSWWWCGLGAPSTRTPRTRTREQIEILSMLCYLNKHRGLTLRRVLAGFGFSLQRRRGL